MNGFDIVKKNGLKNVIAIIENDKFKDLSSEVKNENIEFVTADSYDGLDIIRHSSAHLMAAAIKRLYPNVLFTIGPSIENGFYYDIDLDEKISENELVKIEKEMNNIVKEDLKFAREEVNKNQALEIFKNNKYKIEILNGIELKDGEVLTIYKLGEFVDLCRGPHIPSARYLKNFKLTKVSGAYWRGDAKNKMLQRIYGTAWDTKEKLDLYFKNIEEAEKRDHKKIGKAMDLYHFEPLFAPGAPFYHHNGWFIFRTFVDFLRNLKLNNGYSEVSTPTVMNRCLWEVSGHWDKYGEHNYSGLMEDKTQFCVKPMNCPGGILVYKSSPKSYRDLPLRMAEFGRVNRYEASGALNGLLRVREFTQDDAHIFCTLKQTEDEIYQAIQLFMKIYGILGFNSSNMEIALSTRPEKRIGSEEVWDKSEKFLSNTLDKLKIKFKLQPGEGAFYGPKLEFGFKDAIGHMWQIGTIQLDMNLPNRFELSYIDENGQKVEPVMLHLACFGSIERFLGMYIETIEGKFPLWINPIQAIILNVNEDVEEYCQEIYKKMKNDGMRVELDLNNKTLNSKIRAHSLRKIPYIIVVGDKEKQNNSVAIRIFGEDKQIVLNIDEFINKIKNKVDKKETGFELN